MLSFCSATTGSCIQTVHYNWPIDSRYCTFTPAHRFLAVPRQLNRWQWHWVSKWLPFLVHCWNWIQWLKNLWGTTLRDLDFWKLLTSTNSRVTSMTSTTPMTSTNSRGDLNDLNNDLNDLNMSDELAKDDWLWWLQLTQWPQRIVGVTSTTSTCPQRPQRWPQRFQL